MQEINIAKELVENHSTEEVLLWVEKEAKRIMSYSATSEVPEGFRLGTIAFRAQGLYEVVSALNGRLHPERNNGPVVA